VEEQGNTAALYATINLKGDEKWLKNQELSSLEGNLQ
jgi:hypothetical protein